MTEADPLTNDPSRPQFLPLLAEIWRDASHYAPIDQTLDCMARRVADRLPADLLVLRRLDVERQWVETVAVGACRPEAPVPTRSRTPCSPRVATALLEWGRHGRIVRGRHDGRDRLLAVVAPAVDRECVAVPLLPDRGALGMLVVVLSGEGPFTREHEAFVAQLVEPVGVALDNHARLRELTRLREALEADKQALLSRLQRQDVAASIVGAETGLRDVMDRVERVARTDAPVLVIGETGTGKEVVARAIHAASRRASGPMVRVNCGAIPPGLIDSELFGHERGSFTGAVAARQGWFERADGGTLFLDEVGELPLDAQVRLLRILQDGTFERVGAQRSLTVDVRIVCATHRDLQEMVATGQFREDLWYRISVFPVRLPPLRERVEDIPLLAAAFARSAGLRLRGRILAPSAADIEQLIAYTWPGNVRELAAVIERAAILGDGYELRVASALGLTGAGAGPAHLFRPNGSDEHARPNVAASARGVVAAGGEAHGFEPLDAAMRRHCEGVLSAVGGQLAGRGGAADLLRVNVHTLRARLRKLGVDARAFRGDPAGRPSPAWPAGADGAAEPGSWDAAMRAHIEAALQLTRGRVEGRRGAAARLGVNPHTLRGRMRRLGVDRARFLLA